MKPTELSREQIEEFRRLHADPHGSYITTQAFIDALCNTALRAASGGAEPARDFTKVRLLAEAYSLRGDDCGRLAREILAAPAPEGMVLVPKKPTIIMFKAFHAGIYPQNEEELRVFSARYQHMISVAPSSREA